MDRWLSLCDDDLARLGVAPLGDAPPDLIHYRALLSSPFLPPLLIDAQPSSGHARLIVSRRMPLAQYVDIHHNIRAILPLGDDTPLPPPAEALALRHQDPEPNMRDGVVYMGHVVVCGQRTRFVARALTEAGHARYFNAMSQIAVRFLGRSDPALRILRDE